MSHKHESIKYVVQINYEMHKNTEILAKR